MTATCDDHRRTKSTLANPGPSTHDTTATPQKLKRNSGQFDGLTFSASGIYSLFIQYRWWDSLYSEPQTFTGLAL